MENGGNLTKEFFDIQETDDTLQKIRRQYLESKKNLDNLMMKKQSPANTEEFKILSFSKPEIQKHTNSELDDKLRRELRGFPIQSSTKAAAPRKETADDLIILNEIRSLKNIINEQRSLVYNINNDLQVQRSISYELQSKVESMESHIRHLEWEITSSKNDEVRQSSNTYNSTFDNTGHHNSTFDNTGHHNSTQTGTWRSYATTAPSSSGYGSRLNTKNMNSNSNYMSNDNLYKSYSSVEDSTTRLIKISNPK